MSSHSHASDPSEPGVSVDRRALFWLPVALPAGALLLGTPILGAPVLAADQEEAMDRARSEGALRPLSRDELGLRWQALARELLAGSSADMESYDESYAAQLAGLIARLPAADLPRLEGGRSGRGLTAGLSWQALPGVTVEFRMEPGAELRLHNHPPQIVVTLCAEGEARYRHFEIEGEAPPCTRIDGEPFAVRETRSGVLAPRRSTSLTRVRDGIHGFVAGESGARMIDFTVATTADVETFSYLALSEEPLEPENGLHWARWIGKD